MKIILDYVNVNCVDSEIFADIDSLAKLKDYLAHKYKTIYEYVFDINGDVNGFVNLYLNDKCVTRQLDKNLSVNPEDKLTILTSIAGG